MQSSDQCSIIRSWSIEGPISMCRSTPKKTVLVKSQIIIPKRHLNHINYTHSEMHRKFFPINFCSIISTISSRRNLTRFLKYLLSTLKIFADLSKNQPLFLDKFKYNKWKLLQRKTSSIFSSCSYNILINSFSKLKIPLKKKNHSFENPRLILHIIMNLNFFLRKRRNDLAPSTTPIVTIRNFESPKHQRNIGIAIKSMVSSRLWPSKLPRAARTRVSLVSWTTKVNQFQSRRRFRRLNSCFGAGGRSSAAFPIIIPTYGGLEAHHKGVWCRELPSKDEARPPISLTLSLFVWLACFLLSTLCSTLPPPLFPHQIQLLLFPSPELRCSNFVLRRNSP